MTDRRPCDWCQEKPARTWASVTGGIYCGDPCADAALEAHQEEGWTPPPREELHYLIRKDGVILDRGGGLLDFA